MIIVYFFILLCVLILSILFYNPFLSYHFTTFILLFIMCFYFSMVQHTCSSSHMCLSIQVYFYLFTCIYPCTLLFVWLSIHVHFIICVFINTHSLSSCVVKHACLLSILYDYSYMFIFHCIHCIISTHTFHYIHSIHPYINKNIHIHMHKNPSYIINKYTYIVFIMSISYKYIYTFVLYHSTSSSYISYINHAQGYLTKFESFP